MTSVILLVGPLSVIIGCHYWVMSLGNEQAKHNEVLWAKYK